MTNALAERPVVVPAVTDDQVALITRTVAVGATPDELKLYLYDCARQGVHPLDKLIHFTKRKGKYTPITSIDFMRTRAADTGEYAGSEDAIYGWSREDPQMKAPPASASVTVYRMVQGQRCPFTATARWSEYKPSENDFMWQKMPHTMLAKCAEALALRKGFPRQLAGLYAKEEMDQAGEPSGYTVTAPAPQQRERETGVVPSPGEVGTLPHAAVEGPDDGALRIMRVTVSDTKNKNVKKHTVILSDGRETSTINTQLGALCEQLAQEACPVTVETKTSRWGEDLLAVHRVKAALPEIQINSDLYVHGEPVTVDDISF